MDNYLAPVRTRSLPDLLATQPVNGICPGNRGWGRQGLPAHVSWHRAAIRRICTVHRRVLCTAPYTRDLAGAGVIGACSHAGPGCREVSAAAVGPAASANRPRSKGRNVPGSAQCGSPRRCAPSCCCSCWYSSWKTASACGHQRLRRSRALAVGSRTPGSAGRRPRPGPPARPGAPGPRPAVTAPPASGTTAMLPACCAICPPGTAQFGRTAAFKTFALAVDITTSHPSNLRGDDPMTTRPACPRLARLPPGMPVPGRRRGPPTATA